MLINYLIYQNKYLVISFDAEITMCTIAQLPKSTYFETIGEVSILYIYTKYTDYRYLFGRLRLFLQTPSILSLAFFSYSDFSSQNTMEIEAVDTPPLPCPVQWSPEFISQQSASRDQFQATQESEQESSRKTKVSMVE